MTKEKREYNRLYLIEWRKDPINKEKLKRYRKKWQNAPENKYKVLAIDRKWKANNKDKTLSFGRKYYQKNRERLIRRACAYFKTPHGKRVKKAADNKRRGAEGVFTPEDIKNLYVTQGARCYYCSVSIEDKYEIDHMNPVSKGGSNWVDNICLACVGCNRSKHTKTAEEFMAC